MSAPVLPAPFVETLRGPSSAPPPAARPCVPPPVDDRFELLRRFVADDIGGYKVHSARLLAARATLGDREAWSAVARDMSGPGRGYASDVAEALGRGDLDAAVAEAARVCGETVDAWLQWARDERAAKGGA